MVMVCAPCLATTLSSIAGPAVAGVGAAAIYKGKKKKPSSKKGKKKPPSKKGKKKPPSKKGKKKPSLKKGGGQYGGICDDCYGEECTDCETNRLRDQEDAKYYLENSFEGDAIKYLEKIQKETDHPCRDLIELVQDHGNKKINHLKGEGTLSYQDEVNFFNYLQSINQDVLNSSKQCLEEGDIHLNRLKEDLQNGILTKEEVEYEMDNFTPPSCRICGDKLPDEREKNKMSIDGWEWTRTPIVPDPDNIDPVAPFRGKPPPLNKRTKKKSRKRPATSPIKRKRRGTIDPSKGHKSVGDIDLLRLRVEKIRSKGKIVAKNVEEQKENRPIKQKTKKKRQKRKKEKIKNKK